MLKSVLHCAGYSLALGISSIKALWLSFFSVCIELSFQVFVPSSHKYGFFSFARSSQDFKEGKTPRERGHESMQASDDYKPDLIQEG